MLNRATIIGHLGRDPEVHHTESGQTVANMSVATTDKWQDRQGEWQERTEWHRVAVWGKQADACAEYLSKGRQVYVEGRIETRTYEKDGEKRYSTGIVASRVQFLGGRNGDSAGSRYPNDDTHDDDDNPPF